MDSLCFITYNTLSGLNDPFEFDGNYDEQINKKRYHIIDKLTNSQILLKQLINQDHINKFVNYTEKIGGNKLKVINFFNTMEYNLVATDYIKTKKIVLDKYINDFNLPILGSIIKLKHNRNLQSELIDNLFDYNLLLHIRTILKQKNQPEFFIEHIILYWIYQSIYLEEIKINNLYQDVNITKTWFKNNLGNQEYRSNSISSEIIYNNCNVLFTQEAHPLLQKKLCDFKFLPILKQNGIDGTLVFLDSDIWYSNYQIIKIPKYVNNGKINAIIAKLKNTNEQFMLCSCHGKSTDYKDAINQIQDIQKIWSTFYKNTTKLVIGIDANTKHVNEIYEFCDVIESLNLKVQNNINIPTTIKKRILTAQHEKLNHEYQICEDYIITSKLQEYKNQNVYVGFNSKINDIIPNKLNLSDHYPVKLILKNN